MRLRCGSVIILPDISARWLGRVVFEWYSRYVFDPHSLQTFTKHCHLGPVSLNLEVDSQACSILLVLHVRICLGLSIPRPCAEHIFTYRPSSSSHYFHVKNFSCFISSMGLYLSQTLKSILVSCTISLISSSLNVVPLAGDSRS